jgi:CheY-like chemotaxis protein
LQPRIDGISVLVVDDHKFMQQVMRLMLNSLGLRKVTSAACVDEAMFHLCTEWFDVVIVDYRLDGTTGAEFTRLARAAHGGTKFIPIIACTADTAPETIARLRDAGVDEILAKPVSAQAIWTKLMAITNARRPFVAAPGFFGPDRRRRRKDVPTDRERRSTNTEVEI